MQGQSKTRDRICLEGHIIHTNVLGLILFTSAHQITELGLIMQSRPNTTKPAVLGNRWHAKEKEALGTVFFWEILRFFSRKWFSQWPNTLTLITENLRKFQWDFGSIRKNDRENSFVEAYEITGKSSGLRMQGKGVFLKLFLSRNSLLQAERWREEGGFMIDAVHRHNENNQSRR